MTKNKLHKVKCNICEGNGWTAEHDPYDPHENGCSNCPIQVQCENCHGEGFLYLVDEVNKLDLKTEKDKLKIAAMDIIIKGNYVTSWNMANNMFPQLDLPTLLLLIKQIGEME